MTVSNPFKPGDRVRLMVHVRDAYNEIWHYAGSVEEVKRLTEDGDGLIFGSNLGVHYTCVQEVGCLWVEDEERL